MMPMTVFPPATPTYRCRGYLCGLMVLLLGAISLRPIPQLDGKVRIARTRIGSSRWHDDHLSCGATLDAQRVVLLAELEELLVGEAQAARHP